MERKFDQKDRLDADLYEDISEEEMHRLVLEAQQEAMETSKAETTQSKRPFPKWLFWLIAIAMLVNVLAFFPQTFSIPAIKFLTTSAKLSAQEEIQTFKQAVVVVTTGENKGTGFGISSDGLILTNYHVIDGEKKVTVDFPEEGLFQADVLITKPDLDLAVLRVHGENLPYLDLAEKSSLTEDRSVYVIGNPLRFRGIVNQGEVIGHIQLNNWDQEVFMLDAPIYRGNSGSPVINQQGEVIAVVFATLNHEEYGKVGLAVPIEGIWSMIEPVVYIRKVTMPTTD